MLHVGRQNKQCRGNVEIKQETYKSVGEGVCVSSIAKMPAEVRHKFHSAASSASFEHTTDAAAKECHSTLHLYINICHASSVRSICW